MALHLDNSTLTEHAQHVLVPTYERRALTPAVVHMSVGSFHRSHQAVYFDEIAQQGISQEWGVVGVGLHRREMLEVLTAQDGLYTVVTRGASGTSARIVGVIGRYLFAPERTEAVLDAMAAPQTRLITLTITNGAYAVDANAGNPPRTAMAYLVEALDRRRRAGRAGVTILSCDNLTGNGAITRTAVLGSANARDVRLASWIEEHVTFPSSMVDRITPRTTLEDCERVEREFGVADRWPVVSEPFSQWIIEDDFAAGRPPLDLVGAQFVSDVAPYAHAKTRLLNGAHCAIGPVAYLAGLRRIDQALADPLFERFLAELMEREVAPLLPEVPGLDLTRYRRSLLERFANPAIGDQLARLCRNGSAKMPCHVLPSIAESRAAGRPHPRLTMAVAGWMRYLRGVDLSGRPILVDDPMADRLRGLARTGGTDPRPLLSERGVFGALGEDAAFAMELEQLLQTIETGGVRAAVEASGAAEHELAA